MIKWRAASIIISFDGKKGFRNCGNVAGLEDDILGISLSNSVYSLTFKIKAILPFHS